MILLLAVLLAVFVVPSPWDVALVAAGATVEFGEVLFVLRLSRWFLRPKVGVEAMIGMQAKVVEVCRPNGRVRVHGELWNARCLEGAEKGETVRVERVEDLRLVVARIEASFAEMLTPR